MKQINRELTVMDFDSDAARTRPYGAFTNASEIAGT
jgi:hypothetical protein